jgi:hypothetical protein
MKSIFLSIVTALAFVQFTQAEDITVKITKVHMCCDSCVKGVAKATAGIDGLKATASKEDKLVELSGPECKRRDGPNIES